MKRLKALKKFCTNYILCILVLTGVVGGLKIYSVERTALYSKTYRVLQETINQDYENRIGGIYRHTEGNKRKIYQKIKEQWVYTEKELYHVVYQDSIYVPQARQYADQFMMATQCPVNPSVMAGIFKEKLMENVGGDYSCGIIYRHNGIAQYSLNDTISPRYASCLTPMRFLDFANTVSVQGWVDYDGLTVFVNMHPLGMIGFVVLDFLLPLMLLTGYVIRCYRVHIVFDKDDKLVWIDGKYCAMAKLDRQILKLILKNKDYVVTREEMKQAFWPDSMTADKNIDTHLYTLRKNLADFPRYQLDTVGQGKYQLKCKPFRRIQALGRSFCQNVK